jgi:hypothetical protein
MRVFGQSRRNDKSGGLVFRCAAERGSPWGMFCCHLRQSVSSSSFSVSSTAGRFVIYAVSVVTCGGAAFFLPSLSRCGPVQPSCVLPRDWLGLFDERSGAPAIHLRFLLRPSRLRPLLLAHPASVIPLASSRRSRLLSSEFIPVCGPVRPSCVLPRDWLGRGSASAAHTTLVRDSHPPHFSPLRPVQICTGR